MEGKTFTPESENCSLNFIRWMDSQLVLLNGTETAVLPTDILLGDKLTALTECVWVEGSDRGEPGRLPTLLQLQLFRLPQAVPSGDVFSLIHDIYMF